MKHDEEIIKLERTINEYVLTMPRVVNNLKISQNLIDLINQKVDFLLKRTHDVSDEITGNVVGLCKEDESYLIEMEHRYKGRDRIVEKVYNSVADNLSVSEAIDKIEDALRFTYIVVDNKNYLNIVNKYLEKLESFGYRVYEILNCWGNEYYQGINVIFEYKDIKFEVQFHTTNSFHIKEGYTREPYLVARNTLAAPEMIEKANIIRRYYQKQVIVPEGAIGFQYKKCIKGE